MVIEKLIDNLQKLQKNHPGAQVNLHDRLGRTVLCVVALEKDDGNVWLEDAGDIDVGEEIRARFDYMKENNIEEKEFYQDLIDTGFTLEQIGEHLGNDVLENVILVLELKK